MISQQPDLFAPPRPAPLAAEPPPPSFDLTRHPCVVCGDPLAPFGRGWPHEPKFYCRQHHEAADAVLADQDRQS